MPVLSTKSPAEKRDSSIRVVVRVKPTTPEDEELDKVARPLNITYDRAQGDILGDFEKDILQPIAPAKHYRLVMHPFKSMR